MSENDQKEVRRPGRIWHQVLIGLAVCAVLLIVFHRPILLAIGRQIMVRYAARENLKVDFRVEGNPFGHLIVRNFRAVPTGASAIESIDLGQLDVEYNLFGFMRHGLAHLIEDVELRSTYVVLDPSRAPPRKPQANQKLRLPSVFPERVRLTDVTLVVRDKPEDFVIERVDLDLNPRTPGDLRIQRLQLPPGDSWSNISGKTSYAAKNLILRDLLLSEKEQVRLLTVDASRIDDKKLGLKLECAIGGGELSASSAFEETASSLNAKIDVTAQNIALESLNKFLFLPENSLSGNLDRLAFDGTGIIDAPRTWRGSASLHINNMDRPLFHFDTGVFEVSAENGRATLRAADVIQDKNELHLRGVMELPSTIDGFGREPANLEVAGTAPDLQRLTTGMPIQLSGSAQFSGRVDIANSKIEATLGITAETIAFPNGSIGKLSSTLRASKIVASRNPKPGPATTATTKPWFADLRTAMEFDLSAIRYGDHVVDSVHGSVNGSDDVLGLDRVTLRRNSNELSVRGRYKLPLEIEKASSQPADLDLLLDAPELGDFWVADSLNKFSGPLQMNAQVHWKDETANGQFSISGSNLKTRDLVFQQLNSQGSISNSIVYLNDCRATLNNADFAYAAGTLNLRRPYHYNGKLSARVADLSTLRPLLRSFGNQSELGGALNLDWEGSGDSQISRSSGSLKFALEKGRYGNAQSLRANIDASYSPDGLEVPIIFFASGNTDFQAVAQTKGDTLEITKIQLDQGPARFASGYVSFPLVWRNLGTNAMIPPSGKVLATVQSENLDLKKLFTDLGIKAGTSGILNARLDADGTIGDLNASLKVQMRDLRNDRWPKMDPATFEINAQAVHQRLTVLGKLQQPRIQPLELNADMPFNIPQIVRSGKFPDDTPITAKARLPRSSVNFVRQFVPALEQLDGNLGLDVDVRGTIAKPVFNGAGDVTINVARFTNATLPALTNFSARLIFAQNALSLERFGGDLAGGPFTMNGSVTFPKLTEPTLDLHLKANSVLVARNDTLTARADADIKITGPFATATVSGNVAMTNSHILKNIDLIPIGLPGRPAPEPPSERPEFSFPDPPLRDWKFDIAIKTKDPVLIRGNLATGGAVADLQLGGTGLHPALQGTVRLENVEATLPFSRLDVSNGFLYFDPSDSMNPRLELHGTSVIRDYTVRVYVYGTMLSPEAIFTSEPPLPQEEIISLIATGATRQELSGRGNVLAGRAAMLLVQQLYRKIFKKGEPTDSNEFFNRLDLDVGAVNPRTGRQEVTARFKINDQFVLVGDVGVGGDYRGMLKYLIRFR
ncbi:MAG TPA: translocation/assembly module TamB domain-containing protein [Candidatus Udaeobacter sp.]|nr:translocation/assembly module TamB domain-containing protein [Candidatus Udaeobacter sp.]